MNALAVGVISNILVGARVAIIPRFSVSNFWPEVERSGATIASILGGMGGLLASAPDCDAAKRCVGQIHTVRGNPFTEESKKIWRERFGAKLVGGNGYGLTEACVITSLPAGQYVAPGSSGKRVPDFDVRIVDELDRELPANVAGEIVCRPLRPDIMFMGYWRRPEDTLKIMRNLWLHTGDIGKFDEQGFFYFVDRKKDYLRRRGENISSFEMEVAFARHPALAEVAVHAVPSDKGEDDVKVTAMLRPDTTLSPEDLFRWAIDAVPYYALPRYIEFRDSLPKNPQGRVLKYELRDEGCTPTTWDQETSGIQVKKR
jgi:crotonobetaine/carnitine-CoA ligase